MKQGLDTPPPWPWLHIQMFYTSESDSLDIFNIQVVTWDTEIKIWVDQANKYICLKWNELKLIFTKKNFLLVFLVNFSEPP